MKPIFWAIIVFAAAAIFRLTYLDLIEFKLDEARDVYEMVKFYKEPYLMQRGTIQSTGVYNPPLWYYLLVLISLPSRHPQYLSWMIALLNSGAVVAFYLVVRKYYGNLVGLVSSLLLAFSPWAILFSRKIWAPDLLMLFIVPLFYYLHQSGSKKWFWMALFLSLITQLHASGLFLAVAIIGFLIISRTRISLKYALIGLIVSLIPLIPYLIHQLQTGCSDCQAFLAYQQEGVRVFDANVFLRSFQLINGSSFNIILGTDYDIFLEKYPWVKTFGLIFLLEFLLMVAGIVHSLRIKNYLLLLPMLIVPLLYLITQTQAIMHYFIILIPFVAVVYSQAIDRLFKWKKAIGIIVITFIIIINIIFELVFYQFLSQKQNIEGDYGPIYALTAQEIIADDELTRAEAFVKKFME